MKQHISRISVISAAIATTGVLGATGLASAQSISTTGNGSNNTISSSDSTNTSLFNDNNVGVTNYNYQAATTGDASSNGNTIAGGYGTGQLMSWSQLDPAWAQAHGMSFSDWWSQMMQQMGEYGNSWMNSGNNWAPSGNNWQASWSNWNPATWQMNGQSFGNWYGQMLPYMLNNYNAWQQGWADGSGGAMSGNASNSNNTVTTVSAQNGGTTPGGFADSGNMGNNSIYLTGPHSNNTISSSFNSNYNATNTNNVNVGNSNSQTASSGNASSNGNTIGGSAQSGNADNGSSTQTAVAASNAGSGSGGGYSGGNSGTSSIGLTGPGSNNQISTSSNSNYNSTNTNTVTVTNTSTQTAHSGNASSNGNTIGGFAQTGNAMNNSSSNTQVSARND